MANVELRLKMVKAMEFIARNVCDEEFFDYWLSLGVPDGAIEYGDLTVSDDDAINNGYYTGGGFLEYTQEEADAHFADLMYRFMFLMKMAGKDGISCDDVIAKKEE